MLKEKIGRMSHKKCSIDWWRRRAESFEIWYKSVQLCNYQECRLWLSSSSLSSWSSQPHHSPFSGCQDCTQDLPWLCLGTRQKPLLQCWHQSNQPSLSASWSYPSSAIQEFVSCLWLRPFWPFLRFPWWILVYTGVSSKHGNCCCHYWC